MTVLIAGVSTRAAAESAAGAGFDVTAIDAFGDLDQHPSVRALSLGDRFSPDTAAREARGIACDAVAYGSNFENHPDAVEALSAGRALWGNTSDVIRRVRDPRVLSEALRRRGLAAPAVADEPPVPSPQSPRAWLVKPLASGGGHRVREWRPGARVPRGCYLQEFIDGAPGSAVFVAASGRAVTVGVTRQLIGEAAFGSSGYRYCGNVLSAVGEDHAVLDAARALASAISDEFGLVGVNGVDFIVKDAVPFGVEVNPRWCASMELVERAYGLSLFGVHAAACRDGVLPEFDLNASPHPVEGGTGAVGKAVVYARSDVTVGDTREWLQDADIRDIPKPGARIASGRPVCTVFAAGRDFAACRAELVRSAGRVYARLNAML